jgi:hypothetical protein
MSGTTMTPNRHLNDGSLGAGDDLIDARTPVQRPLPSFTGGFPCMGPVRTEPGTIWREHAVLVERRNPASRLQLRRRVEREFHEMPGLSLTLAQARRLFGLDMDVCFRILRELIQTDALRRTPDGLFVRYSSLP